MEKLEINDVIQYVEKNIGDFHQRRISGITKLSLKKVLSKKNPYLYRAKNELTAESIVKGILDAHISSNEENLFGTWLEGLAIFINNKVYNGGKSGALGIDLEFVKDSTRYFVTIKSGPNWGNSSQVKKMIIDFRAAERTLKTSNSNINCVTVNGCCYGKDNSPYKKDGYYKYCGQQFWEFISGDENLYTNIIEPLGYKAKEKNDEFTQAYSNLINKFVIEFAKDYCNKDGSINWKKLVEYNSKK